MKTVDPNSPGGRLRAARQAMKMSLAELAEAAGFSRGHINLMELNTYKGGLPAWQAAAQVVGLSLDYLLENSELPADGKGASGPQDREVLKNPNEIALIRFYRGLSDEQRDLIFSMVRNAAPARTKSA